jgi:hypothetical protein
MPSETKETEQQPFLDQYANSFLANTCEDEHKFIPLQFRRKKVVSNVVVFTLTSLLWMSLLLMISIVVKPWSSGNEQDIPHNITSGAKFLSCGSSLRDARALECKYDILLNNWVPAPCYDDEFIQEYKDDESWGAYADANLTQRLTSIEKMSEREYYYTSVRDHINHCAIMWKKQFWVLFEERKAFDTMVASPSHTDHCALYLNEVMDRNPTEATKVDVGYAGCWIRQ